MRRDWFVTLLLSLALLACCISSRISPWTRCRPTSVPCSWITVTPRPGWTWARSMSPATSRRTPSSATSTPRAANTAATRRRWRPASNTCRWEPRVRPLDPRYTVTTSKEEHFGGFVSAPLRSRFMSSPLQFVIGEFFNVLLFLWVYSTYL